MKKYAPIAAGLIVTLVCLAAPATAGKKNDTEEPKLVVVQHVLISFKGSNSKKKVTRTKKQAEQLAYELLDRAQKGDDFDALVKEFTDDQHPGIYAMSNRGLGSPAGGVSRDRMVPEFGDIAFGLEPGEVGIARYSPGGSPYGFHVIKRLE